jgi:YVTN family beta-propeller protein
MRSLLLLLLPALAMAQLHVYVANSGDSRITIIDSHTSRVSGELPVSPGPQAIAASADGLRFYVSSSARNAIDVVDRRTMKIFRSVPVGAGPGGIAVSPDGRRIFVCLEAGTGIDVVDTAPLMKMKNIPVGRAMQNIYVTPDQTRLIATSKTDKKLVVINIRTEQVEFEIPIAGTPGGIAIESETSLVIKRLFVQLVGVKGFEAIDYKTRKVTGTTPSTWSGLATSPDSKSLWTGDAVYSLPDMKRVASLTEVGAAAGIVFTPDGRRAFISHPDSDSVSVFDAATYKELAQIPTGSRPTRMVVVQ